MGVRLNAKRVHRRWKPAGTKGVPPKRERDSRPPCSRSKRSGSALAQRPAEEPRVARAVLHQQDARGRVRGGQGRVPSGSLTMENQKSSMDLTTVMNWSRSTGLVM